MDKLILLIDDDILPMKYYLHAFEKSGFKTVQHTNPDEALEFIQKNEGYISGIILDIMMPTGDKYNKSDANQGLTTGILLFKDIKKQYPKIPIIIFTNVKNKETLSKIKSKYIFHKMEEPPFKLLSIVKEILK